MTKIIAKTDIQKQQGKLYFVKADANNNLLICEVDMARKGRPKKHANKK